MCAGRDAKCRDLIKINDQNAILNKNEHGYQISKTKLITEGYVCIPEPLT
jgi:hypothetical protein